MEFFPSEFKQEVSSLITVSDYFHHFINDEMIDEIVKCTNERFSAQEQLLTKNELLGYFGLLLLFGVTKKHDIEISEIWNNESVNHMDWATVCMSRSRFSLISRKICFDQFSIRSERSIIDPKFYKMRTVFNMFKLNCEKGLIPGSNLCIDEQLYSFRGRCAFKQYIPSKPAEYGIKFWALVDCDSGYLLDTDVYLGKINFFKKKNVYFNTINYIKEKNFQQIQTKKTQERMFACHSQKNMLFLIKNVA